MLFRRNSSDRLLTIRIASVNQVPLPRLIINSNQYPPIGQPHGVVAHRTLDPVEAGPPSHIQLNASDTLAP